MKVSGVFLFFTIFTLSATYSQTDFCKGWENGFKEGYCYGSYGCVSPVAPVCPYTSYGENSYKDGYNIGFVRGQSAKKRASSNSNSTEDTALGQLKPIRNDNNFNTQLRDYVRRERALKEQQRLQRNQSLPYFNSLLSKSVKAFKREDYYECVTLYQNSVSTGWYDNKFELATGVSYVNLWRKYGTESYLISAKEILKLSKKHGNPHAKKILKQLKIEEKQKK